MAQEIARSLEKKTVIWEMAGRTGVWDLEIGEAWGTGYDLCHPIPDQLSHGKEIILYRLEPESRARANEGEIKGSRCQFSIKRRKLRLFEYLSVPGILHVYSYLILAQRKNKPMK